MSLYGNTSSLITKKAAVCSEQPIATKIGLEILEKGGNASDAAIATFVAVSILAPSTSGIGGDIQCLFYRKSDNSIQQINGSGKTGLHTTLENVQNAGIHHSSETKYSQEGLWVSIPGAVEGMFNVLRHFGSGKLSMSDILQPVIKLAEEGVTIAPKTAGVWNKASRAFIESKNKDDFLINGKPPQAGDVITAPKLAKCLKEIASKGAEAFYCGPIAERIVSEVKNSGGSLTLDDFKEYHANPPSKAPSQPISIDFQGFTIWEMKPNTTGIVVLVALNVLKKFDLKSLGHNTAEYIHIVAEVIKISYTECWDYICDPDHTTSSFQNLLSETTANKLCKKIDERRASKPEVSFEGGSTTYLAVVDEEGNGSRNSCIASRLL
ncbi:glutathione hydrolase-like YwrD proenzyme [Parasteatoda tepidariorum]|uniref:glutathione hydrolase-like YwrD proenzyme n=1 Tax=Parasteatoda tepidariorum TaxID=114398 RepID=UPI0039BC636A